MKIGVSSYSFSQYIRDGKEDIVSVVKKAAAMGFCAIEFTSIQNEKTPAAELAKILADEAKKHNIEISAYVVGANLLKDTAEEVNAEIARIKSEIDTANILGTKLFRYDVVYSLPRFMTFEQALERVAAPMREIADYAEKYGIMTMIENHGMIFQDADRVIKIYNTVNHKNFSLLVDIGNFMCVDEISALSVSKVANLASHVHIKDFKKVECCGGDVKVKEGYIRTRGCNYILGVAPGEGDVKVSQCVDILKNAGYDGYMDIEYEGNEDCAAALERGLEYLKKLI